MSSRRLGVGMDNRTMTRHEVALEVSGLWFGEQNHDET